MKQRMKGRPIKVSAHAVPRSNGAMLRVTVSHGCTSKTTSRLIKF